MATPEQRISTGLDNDNTESARISGLGDDNEDYALAAMAISDGFRPANAITSRGSQLPSHTHHQSLGRTAPPPRPSSTAKPAYDFALRHDGGMGAVSWRDATSNGTSSSNATSLTRASSVSTDAPYVRPESPYRGPSGPTHPYHLYPQESRLARTASTATTSTVPVQRSSYVGPSGPTHPYGMYPQSTVPAAESSHQDVIAPILIGFPGRPNNYQRRRGPEGEEIAGIIGPDGHTEELPPYTQYPDEAFARKTRPTIQTASALPVFAGAGGIGLATRNPEFASREDLLDSPLSRQSNRSFMTDSPSIHIVNTAGLEDSEKPQLKKWQIIAQTKLCRVIPIWAFVLVGGALILFGIVVGSVFYALRPSKLQSTSQHHDSSGDSSGNGYSTSSVTAQSAVATMTTTFDAKPFSTVPANLPTLPTGTYQLPITTPSAAPAGCFANPAQSVAWSCSIAAALPYQMSIYDIPGQVDTADSEIDLQYRNNSNGLNFLPYGAQPPILNQARVLRLVTDTGSPERGPAWFFETTYNKLVILPENALSVSTSKRDSINARSRGDDMVSDFMGSKGVAQAGDKPWFCYWNGTVLEAFIYVNQTSKAGSQAVPSSTATSTYPSSAPTSVLQSYGQSDDAQFLPCYPKVLKIEERRIPYGDNIAPYCIQQIVNSDYSYHPYFNAAGDKTIVYLNETTPSSISALNSRRPLLADLGSEERAVAPLSKRDSSSQCGCAWLAQ